MFPDIIIDRFFVTHLQSLPFNISRNFNKRWRKLTEYSWLLHSFFQMFLTSNSALVSELKKNIYQILQSDFLVFLANKHFYFVNEGKTLWHLVSGAILMKMGCFGKKCPINLLRNVLTYWSYFKNLMYNPQTPPVLSFS